jgi:hypothetical protein
MPHILGLPTELLIQIFLGLDVSDFGSCLMTCRRLKAIIQDSCLLQYLIRTALTGVHDPLDSGPPLIRRLESFRRWSDTWRQPGAYLRFPSRILTYPLKNSTDLLLYDDYVIAMDFSGRHGYRHVASYAWLDLREPSDAWTNIHFEEKLVPLAFTLDFTLDTDQQDLLAVLLG